jgi:hypothetical protein
MVNAPLNPNFTSPLHSTPRWWVERPLFPKSHHLLDPELLGFPGLRLFLQGSHLHLAMGGRSEGEDLQKQNWRSFEKKIEKRREEKSGDLQ